MNTQMTRLNSNYEQLGHVMGVNQFRTFYRVILPLCLPTVVDIFFYLFVNTLTTISAVIFLYSSDTTLASITIMNMDDAGDIASASAMGTIIFIIAISAKLIQNCILTYITNRNC